MIELSNFQKKTILHKVLNPETGKVIDEAFTVEIRGDSSPEVQEAKVQNKIQLRAMLQKHSDEKIGLSDEEKIREEKEVSDKMTLNLALAHTAKINGATLEGKPVGEDKDSIATVLKSTPFLMEQIVGVGQSVGSFLPQEK